jgi:hypothetical protein
VTQVLHYLVCLQRSQATFNTCAWEGCSHALTWKKIYPMYANRDVPYAEYATGRVNFIGVKAVRVLWQDLMAVIRCFFDLMIPIIQELPVAANNILNY